MVFPNWNDNAKTKFDIQVEIMLVFGAWQGADFLTYAIWFAWFVLICWSLCSAIRYKVYSAGGAWTIVKEDPTALDKVRGALFKYMNIP